MMLSFAVSGTIWVWIFRSRGGLINETLNLVGLGSFTQSWIADPSIVMLSLGVAGIWHIIGYPIILFSAGLVDIPEDVMDLYPDVAVGRLACRSTTEVQDAVAKIISYETTTYGADWFERISVY